MSRVKNAVQMDFIGLNEACARASISLDERLFLAAEGKLTIHVKADHWKVETVFDIGELKSGNESILITPEGEPFNSETHDLNIGRKTIYAKNGKYHSLYANLQTGLLPIAKGALKAIEKVTRLLASISI